MPLLLVSSAACNSCADVREVLKSVVMSHNYGVVSSRRMLLGSKQVCAVDHVHAPEHLLQHSASGNQRKVLNVSFLLRPPSTPKQEDVQACREAATRSPRQRTSTRTSETTVCSRPSARATLRKLNWPSMSSREKR